MGMYGDPPQKAVFESEDTLKAFVDALNAHERSGLYMMLHALGCRFDPTALERWRKSK